MSEDKNNMDKSGFICIVKHESLEEGFYKILSTTRSGIAVANELNKKAKKIGPGVYICINTYLSQNCGLDEQKIHDRLKRKKVKKEDEEFFKVGLEEAKRIIKQECGSKASGNQEPESDVTDAVSPLPQLTLHTEALRKVKNENVDDELKESVEAEEDKGGNIFFWIVIGLSLIAMGYYAFTTMQARQRDAEIEKEEEAKLAVAENLKKEQLKLVEKKLDELEKIKNREEEYAKLKEAAEDKNKLGKDCNQSIILPLNGYSKYDELFRTSTNTIDTRVKNNSNKGIVLWVVDSKQDNVTHAMFYLYRGLETVINMPNVDYRLKVSVGAKVFCENSLYPIDVPTIPIRGTIKTINEPIIERVIELNADNGSDQLKVITYPVKE